MDRLIIAILMVMGCSGCGLNKLPNLIAAPEAEGDVSIDSLNLPEKAKEHVGDVTIDDTNLWLFIGPGEARAETLSMRCQYCGQTNVVGRGY